MGLFGKKKEDNKTINHPSMHFSDEAFKSLSKAPDLNLADEDEQSDAAA